MMTMCKSKGNPRTSFGLGTWCGGEQFVSTSGHGENPHGQADRSSNDQRRKLPHAYPGEISLAQRQRETTPTRLVDIV